MSALDLVRDEIVGKARAQGYELTPWFETNQSRLRVFSDGLQRILGRLPVINGDSDRARAEIAHSQLRSAIERLRPPEEVAWFERNRALLISIGAAISGQQREQAAIEFTGRVRPLSASTPPLESYELRSEAERTLANIEAIQILTSKQALDDADRARLRDAPLRFEVIAGAGHHLVDRRPDETAAAIGRFLASL